MKRSIVPVPAVLAVAVAASAAMPAPASAVSNLTKIREVFAGVAAAPDAQYVELQMSQAFQNQVAGKQIKVFGASGAEVATFTFLTPVPVFTDQSSILVATPEAETFFGVGADLEMPTASIPAAGGRVCLADALTGEAIDCVAWGTYSGPSAGSGKPFRHGVHGIPAGATIQRDIGRGDAGRLDAPDDTDRSAADFRFAVASPRNNVGQEGAAPGGALGFASTAVTVPESAGTASLELHRSGAPAGRVGGRITSTGGTATPGADYGAVDATVSLGPGARTGAAPAAIHDDRRVEPTETLGVRLRNPTGGAVLGPAMDATVTILDDDGPDTVGPVTQITRPKHGKSYRSGRLPVLKGTAFDAGTDVRVVEVGLRQKRADGSCRWWNGARFIPRSCGMKLFQSADGSSWWRYDLPRPLKRSVGTKVRNYTLFARSWDTAGNVEESFDRGRNRNRFEVT